ncbi:MAG: hypothetical protein QGG34_13275 [SAR202 cluster bacterium]|nr:hypothetical protein [Dehalococcoidales bacterium]MDP6072505.1 hypothetical protein [SAR202 cluster bacterium]MDP7104114.1 hypothetical protein [SAR202 cluster bacterium]MDP7224166.1 hypothetical protein [SAR202 cluster bacterium]
MRGRTDPKTSMLASWASKVTSKHPLRTIQAVFNKASAELSVTFDGMYAGVGRISIFSLSDF